MYAFASALEQIPIILAENSGLDPIDAITELRSKHDKGLYTYGIDAHTRMLVDTVKAGIIEPLIVKEHVLKTAYETAATILRINEVIDRRKAKRYLEDTLKELKEKREERKIPD